MSFADALKANNTRHRVNLSYSTTSDSGTSALADALKTTASVTEINQSLATIGDSGAVALADVLKANEGRWHRRANRTGPSTSIELNEHTTTTRQVAPVPTGAWTHAEMIRTKLLMWMR